MSISEGFTKAIEKINNSDVSGLQELLKSREVEIDEEDDHGMTLLQHAAFKGKKELCQLLLDLVGYLYELTYLYMLSCVEHFKGS